MENNLTEVRCLICGLPFSALGRHLGTHKTNAREYVLKFPGALTVCKGLSVVLSQAGITKKNYERTDEIKRHISAKVSASLMGHVTTEETLMKLRG